MALVFRFIFDPPKRGEIRAKMPGGLSRVKGTKFSFHTSVLKDARRGEIKEK